MSDISSWISEKANDAFRALLEDKHLYQSVTLDRQALYQDAEGAGQFHANNVRQQIDTAIDDAWHALDEISIQRLSRARTDDTEFPPRIYFFVETIKTFCASCHEKTPFNLLRAIDVYQDKDNGWRTIRHPKDAQDFVFLFECQSCKLPADVFLVRRRGEKLTLSGRAPIEFQDVPRYIPRDFRQYFSGAVVAFQSGQVLCGIFMLRTLVEQFVLSKVSDKLQGVKIPEALDLYAQELPKDFRERFPPLKVIYGKLSEAVHSARADEKLWEESKQDIMRHFEALDLFSRTS